MSDSLNGKGPKSEVVDLNKVRKLRQKRERAGASAKAGNRAASSGSGLRFTDYLKFFGLLLIMAMMMHYCQVG